MIKRVGILGKGDEVTNVFPYGERIAISVRLKDRSVKVSLLAKNSEGLMFVDESFLICEGDGSIEATDGLTKVSTF